MSRDLPACPDFASFYRTVNNRNPFPWQSRLAKQVRDGEWPSLVGIPTGLGKTACLDIAVWALAANAHLTPHERTAPTRLWWVVNRRLLVDDTYQHACNLAAAIETATEGCLLTVAARLRSLSGDRYAGNLKPAPLRVIRLRGGVSAERPINPVQPTVICSTIPMYGSRVLFRGYGSSRSTRPIDAALAYTDTLVVCDEAHLAEHLIEMFAQIAHIDEGEAGPVLPRGRHRPKVVAVTATGDSRGERFELGSDDYKHSLVGQRLYTAKPVKVVRASPTKTDLGVARHIEREVRSLLTGRPPSSCLVFVNTPATARAVVQRLKTPTSVKNLGNPTLVMLTGRMREREAESVRKLVLDPKTGMRAGGARQDPKSHLIVVATQTLEVGADLDAECLVTEACGVRALTQRLGRLNRLGQHKDPVGVYVHIPPTKGPNPQWRVYGEEPNKVFKRLESAMTGSDPVDLSPGRLGDGVLGTPRDHPGRAGRVSMGLIHEWAQSSAQTPGEAPVEPFFSGLSERPTGVQIVWRAHLPRVDQRVWPAPTDLESIEVPVWEAEEGLADVAVHVRRVTPDGICRAVDTDQEQGRLLLRPGWTLIIKSSSGKMDEHGWNPEANESVVDASILSHGIPVDVGAFSVLYPGGLPLEEETVLDAADERRDGEPVDNADRREAARRLIAALSKVPPNGYPSDEWGDLIADLHPVPGRGPGEVARLQRKMPYLGVGRDQPQRSVRFEALEELSRGIRVGLRQHGREAREFAETYAAILGLNNDMIAVLAHAAEWHDVGKADPRFQLWLKASSVDDGELLAKSNTPRHLWGTFRKRAGWPRGGRHEALSGRLVQRWIEDNRGALGSEDAELLVHLVVSHHGFGRPLIPPVPDRSGVGVTASYPLGNNALTTVDADLRSVDWRQPARFARLNSRYGYWGLALLETIVRQADWTASGGHLEIR